MSLRRDHAPPRGMLLAFIALALQALIPFFLAVEIARAANPAAADGISICSSLGHHAGTSSDQPSNGSCPICAAVAASYTFAAPPPLAVPLPRRCDKVDLSGAPLPGTFSFLAPAYQSRGPPAIA